MEHYVGAHTVDTGGIHMAARRAANADMRALQIFSAIPKYYNERVSVRPERAERFRETIAATKIAPERIQTRGFGSSRLLVPGDKSIEEQAPNRRVELVIKTNRK